MTLPSAFRARDPRAAAHTIALVLGVCAVVFGSYSVLGPEALTRDVRPVVWPSTIGTGVVALVFRAVPAERLDRAGAFLMFALGGVLSLCVLDLLLGRCSIGTQFFLALAVLYAGFHLRKAAVAWVTGTALAADAVMLLLLEPVADAVTDLLFSGLTLVVMAALLLRSGQAQDRLVAELERRASVDALTGLLTRRVFDDALTSALAADGPLVGSALVMMDVDHFKDINDDYGHPVGDDVLVHLARVIAGCVRAGDGVVSRLGGDELAVLLPGCSLPAATRRAEQLLDAVRAAPLLLADGTLMALSVSVGVAHAPSSGSTLRDLYAAADTALYQAKRSGRGRVAQAGG